MFLLSVPLNLFGTAGLYLSTLISEGPVNRRCSSLHGLNYSSLNSTSCLYINGFSESIRDRCPTCPLPLPWSTLTVQSYSCSISVNTTPPESTAVTTFSAIVPPTCSMTLLCLCIVVRAQLKYWFRSYPPHNLNWQMYSQPSRRLKTRLYSHGDWLSLSRCFQRRELSLPAHPPALYPSLMTTQFRHPPPWDCGVPPVSRHSLIGQSFVMSHVYMIFVLLY